jgi:RNA polymerase sigma-70 factor (ECF subfamily)
MREAKRDERPALAEPPSLDSTIVVLDRARGGDIGARQELLARTIGPLRRWAHRMLPGYARAGANTEDIVQDVVVRALQGLPRFEYTTAGAVLAYLRTSVRNRITDEVRQSVRRGVSEELVDTPDDSYSPLEELILRERSARYVAALRALRPDERLLLILRLEQRLAFDEIARRVQRPNANAARVAFNRALKRLAGHLQIEIPPAVKR